jgi:hypothetical protein
MHLIAFRLPTPVVLALPAVGGMVTVALFLTLPWNWIRA